MASEVEEWARPWWQRPDGEKRLESEIERFSRVKGNWSLINDPRDSMQVVDEAYRNFRYWSMGDLCQCFIWRGEVKISYGLPGQKLRHFRWNIDFIYPSNYPYDRILVRVISPQLGPTRHAYGPKRDLLCYMPFSPNAWTTGTTNLDVFERVRNWFRGYLSDWKYGEHIDLPEPLSHVIPCGYDIYLLDHCYEKNENLGFGFLTLVTRTPLTQRYGGAAIAKSLYDLASKKASSDASFAEKIFEAAILKGKGKEEFDVAWLDLNEELPYITTPEELFKTIRSSWPLKNGKFQNWWINFLGTARNRNQPANLLIRFPTTRGAPEWAGYSIWPSRQLHPDCDWLSVTKEIGPQGTKVPTNWSSLTLEAIFATGHFFSFRVLSARQRDLFRRSQGLPYEASKLHGKRVALIGCGALGSPAAALLARSGVGNFTLVDGDTMMHWNVMRHELNLNAVGKKKTDGLFDALILINPYVSIREVGTVQSPESISDAIKDADVVLVAVADDALEESINRIAVSLNKPTLYARALAQMEVGRVHRVLPGEDACFFCLHAHANGHGTPQSDPWLRIDGGESNLIYDEGCGLAAVPGAGVDTQAIGNLLARRALDVLLDKNTPENHWIVVNRAQPQLLDARAWREGLTQSLLLEPIEGCPHCNDQQARKILEPSNFVADQTASRPKDGATFDRVEISASAFGTIVSEASSYGRLETGGVLVGYVDVPNNLLKITHATDAGPNAKHGRSTFARDVRYCQDRVDALVRASQLGEDYVGEWHRHPSLRTQPSPTDRSSLIGIAASPCYHVTQPIMLILGLPDHRNEKTFQVEVHSFVDGWTQVKTLPWTIWTD